ncbi:hypothetical protein BDA96_10G100300 [Sorghum bicolor]|jgi:hypothetical protein|uniref:CP12 domain-containing protein n=2 Tax=Sorghum bicolor TaxID=4558 RepID=A0A921U0I4_SORBI|nr:calvin cycle protein CP12-1, chloroplastic [Sorghum bicolor]EER88061.1 hypothetical protein SORBI_3010G082800 [Sorghum bicolor]KAG0513415.1 hypothetical protein BDA96_10G100300 [Sorghum bicolor]|eukprot:XP_002436694.1 calvin cycle protein CP12-1, chloroplastic [Sorghum bicolor]
MASTVASLSIPATTFAAAAAGDVLPRRKAAATGRVWFPVARRGGGFAVRSTGPATPSNISDKLSESIKEAEETCADEKGTAECAAAWDNVEEISAAASHARDNLKENSDPLEKYCKENPETDECRIYDN